MKEYNVQEHGKEYVVEICDNGDKHWSYLGKRHRDYGPASQYANGSKYWFKDNLWCRYDGCALDWLENGRYYYIDDNTKSFYDLLFYEETKGDIK
jgi:hypothetical protein